jgi:hypothetical protein
MAATGISSAWAADEGGSERLPQLDIPAPVRQRRLTVLLRALLLIPQWIALFFLGIAAFVVMVVGWFAALVLGRLPSSIAGFLTGYLGYNTRVMASTGLLVDRYPPFALRAPEDYPVQVEVTPVPLNRLAVFFRILLMIPAAIINGVVTTGWSTLAFFVWLVALVLGRMPEPLFQSTAAILRYQMRLSAYIMMLASAYPKRLFGDAAAPDGAGRSATRPLLVGGAGKVLLVVFIVFGVANLATQGATTPSSGSDSSGTAAMADTR